MSAPVVFNTLVDKGAVTLGASTTAPTMGSMTTNQLSWFVMGPVMFLWGKLVEGTDAAAGSGTYLVPIPGGYTAHADFCPSGTTAIGSNVGVASGTDGTISGQGHVSVYNSSNLALCLFKNDSTSDSALIENLVGSAYMGLGGGSAQYVFSAVIPLADRNYTY